MDGDVEFSEARRRRMKYPRGFEVMEVTDAGADPVISMSPAAAGFTRLNLSSERRRQLGVKVGDRVLVQYWLDITPAVAAFDPSPYTDPAEPAAMPEPERGGYKYGGML